ncbi:uncharacterized protein CLUP02_17310 [Colletotrichum lupini]|uniref:Uncharacterized protein n=1 Tax=Colletotrichum lupini TaxID=145971 RepID=A0A9Q8WAN2_9PEZI|nr:uncharacterized protein CLUP02_17310 [Colletotrichum lupini]UQC75802.1 hypothetical protein CLUP02_17310 [Colletotrichum lupini]
MNLSLGILGAPDLRSQTQFHKVPVNLQNTKTFAPLPWHFRAEPHPSSWLFARIHLSPLCVLKSNGHALIYLPSLTLSLLTSHLYGGVILHLPNWILGPWKLLQRRFVPSA